MSAQPSNSPLVAHMVYFTLKDPSAAAEQKLVADCRRYLAGIPGIVFFAVGTLIPDLARPVNVRDFHVGLHVVFESRQAHDAYQVDQRHQAFIAENKDTWQQVRVFDCAAA
jgi:hypothetical protein